MKKYWTAYAISLQEVLQLRWSLAMDRVRSLALILSLFFMWDSLLVGRSEFLGYDRGQMIGYVLGISFLRAFALSGQSWLLIHEISSGKLSAWLLRPIGIFSYRFTRDLAQKTVFAASALLEIGALVWLFDAPVRLPSPAGAAAFALSAALATLLGFMLTMLVCSAAFWTAESIGPMFCFELVVQFCAGAFFPLDVLPLWAQKGLALTPFPYLVHFPLQLWLGRGAAVLPGLALQAAWAAALYLVLRRAWAAGLRDYGAEGG